MGKSYRWKWGILPDDGQACLRMKPRLQRFGVFSVDGVEECLDSRFDAGCAGGLFGGCHGGAVIVEL